METVKTAEQPEEIGIVYKPIISETIKKLGIGQSFVFKVPEFKIANVRNAVFNLNRERNGMIFLCSEKGYKDAIEVWRTQ